MSVSVVSIPAHEPIMRSVFGFIKTFRYEINVVMSCMLVRVLPENFSFQTKGELCLEKCVVKYKINQQKT